MILIINSATSRWSSFDPTSMKRLRQGRRLNRRLASSAELIGVIVNSLGGSVGIKSLAEVTDDELMEEERACLDELRHLKESKIWVASDSAYFQSLPVSAFSYLIGEVAARRLGRFGLIHADLAEKAAQSLGRPLMELNLITLFLDEESSVAAVKEGIPIEVSTGRSSLEGLPGARSAGSIDGQIILDLVKRYGTVKAGKMLTEQSGVLGSSGLRGSLAQILSKTKSRTHPKLMLALRIYLHRLLLQIGAYQALLGRVDAVVFSGVLGIKSEFLRDGLTASLGILKTSNVLVIEADPDRFLAQQISRL